MKNINNIVLAIVLIAALSSVASAAELHVGAELEYTTIQDAVNAAVNGDVIVVHAGIYIENVEINTKELTLQGEGADLVTVEAADTTGSVFQVNEKDVAISGFTITGATDGDWGAGIRSTSKNCNISCNHISGNRYGIVMGYLEDSKNNKITGNEITYNEEGIYLLGSTRNNITCNLVQNNLVSGIHLTSGSTGNVIEHNNIIENGVYNRVTRGWEWNLRNGQSNNVTVKHNHWGTTDPEVIAASVREDSGSVDYSSFENETCTCTPIPEPYTISEANAPVLHVGTGRKYTTIQAAVNAAVSGDVIVVHAGTYRENVEINISSITLLGEGMDLVTVEAVDAAGDVFYVTTDYVNISGFTVTGATGWSWGTGISIGAGSDHCNVSGNNVSGNRYGIIMVHENSYTTIENNIIRSNTERGIYFQCQQNTHSTITGNEIAYNGDGIYMYWSAGNNITCNLVQNNSVSGIYMIISTGNNITCNLVQNNLVSGIHLTSGSTGNVIEHNNIIENGVYNRVTRGWEWNLRNGQSNNVTVKHNHWGTTDPEVIAASIREDSGSMVDYSSFENETCTCTPTPEPYTISEASS